MLLTFLPNEFSRLYLQPCDLEDENSKIARSELTRTSLSILILALPNILNLKKNRPPDSRVVGRSSEIRSVGMLIILIHES